MSDNIQFIDVDSEDFEDAPRALREHVKKLQSRLRNVETERDDYRQKWQARATNDALAEYGFRNPKRVSRDLIADGVDISDTDAVKAWVAENGDDYARGEAAQAPAEQTVNNDHEDEAAARGVINDASAQAVDVAPNDRMKAALAEITPDMTPQEVVDVYAKHGI